MRKPRTRSAPVYEYTTDCVELLSVRHAEPIERRWANAASWELDTRSGGALQARDQCLRTRTMS